MVGRQDQRPGGLMAERVHLGPAPLEGWLLSVEEYTRLLERDEFLSALEAAGVDNWEGYDAAIRILNGEDD